MSYFEFPHTRSYEGDLGYILKKVIELSESYDKFFKYNTIHFADPITWNITTQYAPFTIVFDEDHEASYISKRPVPAGITLDNTDFWSFVGPLIVDSYARTAIERILHFITNSYESGVVAASVHLVGDYIIAGGALYVVTSPINIGDHITMGINVIPTTIENIIHNIVNSSLPTVDQSLNPNSTNPIANAPVASRCIELDGRITSALSLINNVINTVSSLDTRISQEVNDRVDADAANYTRIYNIVALPEGSTQGDAELMDIRVGQNGITYPTAGDSVRGQFADIYSKINQDLTKTLPAGQFTVVPFPIIKGCRYSIDNNTTSTIGVRTLQADGTSKTWFDMNAGTTNSFIADTNYVSFRIWVNNAGAVRMYAPSLYDDIGALNTRADTAEKDMDVIEPMLTPIDNMFDASGVWTPITLNKYIDYSSGVEYTNNSFEYAIIPVEALAPYSVNIANSQIAFFTSSDAYISGVLVPGGIGRYDITAPASAAYMAWSIPQAATNTATCVYGHRTPPTDPTFVMGINEKYISMKNIIRVGPKQKYKTIQSAINAAVDGDTIIIEKGVYNESVNMVATNKFLHLIGQGSDATIIQTNGGDYNYPALQIGCGLVENMGFITTATTPDPGASICSYAVHIDYDISANNALQFNNCRFKTASQPAVGIGLRENFTLTFNNCSFEANASAFYCHEQQASNKRNQKVIINNCSIHTKGNNSPAIQLQETRTYTNNEAILLIQGSIAKRNNSEQPVIAMKEYPDSAQPQGSNYLDSYSWYLETMSDLNNESILNSEG